MSFHAASKRLNDRPADTIFPALSLHADHVEAQFVFIDNPINTAVTRLSKVHPALWQSAAVAHCNQQIEHESLEECRIAIQDLFEQVVCQSTSYFVVCGLHCLVRRSII